MLAFTDAYTVEYSCICFAPCFQAFVPLFVKINAGALAVAVAKNRTKQKGHKLGHVKVNQRSPTSNSSQKPPFAVGSAWFCGVNSWTRFFMFVTLIRVALNGCNETL